MSAGTVGNIESGTRNIDKSAVKLAIALRVRPEWLVRGELPIRTGEPVAPVTWPFTRITQARWFALSDLDRGYLEGKVEGLMHDIETATRKRIAA